ncbi:MAG TPA: PilW family protein [Thiopseudomonas sp.]|nr:PilW family protein [Thiopseudomonas sp.]
MRMIVKQRQAGLSLVELMIAMTLGILLMLGVTQVFLSSKATYVSNQQLSQIQESGRFAMEFLTRDIRNAGYKGQCIDSPRNHIATNVNDLWSRPEGAVWGWQSGGSAPLAGISAQSNGLFIQFAAGGNESFDGVPANTAGEPEVKWGSTLLSSPVKMGDIALIADGQGCDLFEIESISDNSIVRKGNLHWSHNYTSSFELLRLESLAYYVVDDEQGTPTLYRSHFNNELKMDETHVLVPGVRAMQFEYGVGLDADFKRGVITKYVTAKDVENWEAVLAVRVTLTIEAASGLQKDFSTLIGLRNRLP